MSGEAKEISKQQLRDLEIEMVAEAPAPGETLEGVVQRQKQQEPQEASLGAERSEERVRVEEDISGKKRTDRTQNVVKPDDFLVDNPNPKIEDDAMKAKIDSVLGTSNRDREEWEAFFNSKLTQLQQTHPNLEPAQYRELLWSEWKSRSFSPGSFVEGVVGEMLSDLSSPNLSDNKIAPTTTTTTTTTTSTKAISAGSGDVSSNTQGRVGDGEEDRKDSTDTARGDRNENMIDRDQADVGVGVGDVRGVGDVGDQSSRDIAKDKDNMDIGDDADNLNEKNNNKASNERDSLERKFPFLSEDQLADMPKKELINLLQSHAPVDFKVSHSINGLAKNVAKKLRRDDLVTMYHELEATLGGGPVS